MYAKERKNRSVILKAQYKLCGKVKTTPEFLPLEEWGRDETNDENIKIRGGSNLRVSVNLV